MKAPILSFAPAILLLLMPGLTQAKDLPLHQLSLPEGFTISVYAEVENARQMAMGDGVLYVGSRRAGKVHAVVDDNKDGTPDRVVLIAEGLNLPSGIAYKDGDLYVGAVSTIYRYADIDHHLEAPPKPEIIVDDFPSERHHGWKYLGFGPDGMLYVPVGAPCNICLSEDPEFAAIMRMDVNKPGKREIVAHGVRNTVGFDWHPETDELWFTDNGRDWLGDDSPACELNRVTRDGQHFGYPYLHANDVIDPEFGDKTPADAAFVQPMVELGSHVAPLGMHFYRGNQFPEGYKHRALIAEHGSWNRTPEAGHTGYRLTITSGSGDTMTYETFIDGWLQDNAPWGRPVDIMEQSDGSLLISDDLAGVIYQLSYLP